MSKGIAATVKISGIYLTVIAAAVATLISLCLYFSPSMREWRSTGPLVIYYPFSVWLCATGVGIVRL